MHSFNQEIRSAVNEVEQTCVFYEDIKWLAGRTSIIVHDIPDGSHSIQAEASWAAHHRPNDILSTLNHPEI